MLINQNRNSPRLILRVAVLATGLALLAGCAQHGRHKAPEPGPHNHERTRFDNPDLRLPHSDVPYGSTDWKAVVTALGGAGKKAGSMTKTAGSYGKVMWEGTGGRVVDIAAGRVVREAPGPVSACGYAWPANGKISRGFRPSDNHKGLDVTAEIGTPIYAARPGKVIYASNELSGFGNCIIIQHDPVWTTFYAHNNRNFVQAGDIVHCGQVIAEVGKTGRATGPHLHFEIRENGVPLDPHPMLP